MQTLKFCFLVGFIILFASCQENVMFSNYESFNDGWPKEDTLVFEFEAPDTIRSFNLFFNTRLNQDYAFDNLFLISSISFPNGKQIVDTLEYEMAHPNGELMGKGFGSVKESKLWYKSDVNFIEEGEYKIKVNHAMRRFENIKELDTLKGIMDFGMQLETVEQAEN